MRAAVTPAELRARATKLVARDARSWAATGTEDPVLEIPLHPPTERDVLADLDAARDWVAAWHRADRDADIEIVWAVRDWPRVGSQTVPERARVRGADAIARVAGAEVAWLLLAARLGALRGVVGSGGDATAALRSNARVVAALDDADFERLVHVLDWLRQHPVSGMRVRELPIRGIHTKWIEARRGLVETLHRVGTGASGLGLHESMPLVRMRFLDPGPSPVGLTDVTAPVDDLARLRFTPDRVFVFENLATVLAMPPATGAVVVHGGGHRVDLIARLPWARTVTYWGDLDSHGFAILHQLRAAGVRATSILMDAETLLAHRDLWVEDPRPNTGVFGRLTPAESRTLQLLSAQGNVRLEQERIPWDYALERLEVE